MIIDGRFDWASWEGGPADRDRFGTNNLTVIILHSLEGRRGSYSALFDPSRDPTAWHGTVGYDGTLYQHYDVRRRLAASNEGNPWGPAFEAEGGIDDGDAGSVDEPLTEAQVFTYLRIIRDMEAYTGMEYRPGERKFGLTEHNHWGQTACPSGRYQPLYDAIAAGALEDELSAQQLEELKALQMRRQLAALAADLGRYEEMKDTYRYAESKGYIKVVPSL